MDAVTPIPVIDETKLNALGQRLFTLWGVHKSDRKAAEDKWLQNMRAFKGIYDPEVLALIGADQSKAYPKMLRWKVVGTVARLMQLLFPQTEKNYGIKPSPLPDLSVEQLQEVLDTLVNLTAQEKQIDPSQVELKDDVIEKAIYEYAAHKAANMEKKLDDDFAEMEFITLARKVVFSACLYSVGLLKGPLHRKIKARKWQKNPNTGKYEAIEVDAYKPFYEYLRLWDWYPDMTADTLDKQDGTFERHVMTREQVEELATRPDFITARVLLWLKTHLVGNYEAQWWETVMKGEVKGDKIYSTSKETRKYEVLSYWGAVSGHELRAAGIEIADADLGKSLRANCWMIGNTVIKAKLEPLEGIPHYHPFVFEEDDLSLLGNSQADVLRDSGLSICETARAALDNMSVIGPMAVVNDDLLTPGQSTSIRKHKTWHIEGLAANQSLNAAVGNVSIDSHLPDLERLLAMFMDFANQESGLPPPSVGDTAQGGSEALRTTKNASMFLGAAALPLRDTVRNYDTFTISVVGGLVAWNKKFAPNPNRDGDMDVIARGSTSLIAKEVLAGNLEGFKAGLTPEDTVYVDHRKLLMVRAKANDIPTDEILLDEDKAEALIAANQQRQDRQLDLQEGLLRAQVEAELTTSILNVAQAHKADAAIDHDAEKITLAAQQLLLDAIASGHENAIKQKVASKPAPKGGSK